MKPSEELMLLLELNNYNIDKFRLKMQIGYEETGNLKLASLKKYSDIIVSHYLYGDNLDYFSRNPLAYKLSWDASVESLDQFKVKHIHLQKVITLKKLINLEEINEFNKERILNDIFFNWEEEYSESSIRSLDNLRQVINLLSKNNKKYRKPSIWAFLFTLLLALVNVLVYKNPSVLQLSSLLFVNDFIYDWNQVLIDVSWYRLLGVFSTLLLSLYTLRNYTFSRLIRRVLRKTNKLPNKIFSKLGKDIEKARLNQSSLLKSYVTSVIKNPSESKFLVVRLTGPGILMDKAKVYVKTVEKKHDWMTNNYTKYMIYLRLLFLFVFALNIAYMGVGFAIIRGLINV